MAMIKRLMVFGGSLLLSTCICAAPIPAKLLDRIERNFGEEARQRVVAWQLLVAGMAAEKATTEQDHIQQANDFFNQLLWVSDIEHWGKEDYWATPIETLMTNGGDCEDFSIGKYVTLDAGGINVDKLRITYVKALEYNQAHMVLAYYPTPEGEPLILDNINKTILPASQRQDLLPVYSFNADSLWLAKSRSDRLSQNSQASLPQWREVHERMLTEYLFLAN